MFRTILAALTLPALTIAPDTHAGGEQWSQLYRTTAPGSFNQNGVAVGAHDAIAATSSRFGAYDPINDRNYSAVSVDLYQRADRGWLRETSFRFPELAIQTLGDAVSPRRIAIDDSRLVFGLPGINLDGHIASFTRDKQGAWTPDPGLRPLPAISGRYAANEVILDDDTLIVTVPFANRAVEEFGEVWVLERTDDSNDWRIRQRIAAPEPREGARFGWSISLHDDTLLITEAGRRGMSGVPSVLGRAHIFHRADDGWEHRHTLEDPQSQFTSSFGHSAAISGDLAVIGAPAYLLDGVNNGAALVFERDDDAWSHSQTIYMPEGDTDGSAEFGNSVAVHDNVVFVGAPGARSPTDAFPLRTGLAFLFQRQPDDSFSLVTDFARSQPVEEAGFGRSVALTADYGFIGAPDGDRGALYLAPREPECFRDLRADANNDGVTNFEDLNAVLADFGLEGDDLDADLNNDSVVDFIDLNFVLVTFGSPCLPPN